MEAIIQKFIEDIQHLSVAELRALCAELKRENEDLQSIISVYRESDTNIARDYQAAQDKIADLERKLKALQKSYDHIAAQNDLLTRHRFGSHNEWRRFTLRERTVRVPLPRCASPFYVMRATAWDVTPRRIW